MPPHRRPRTGTSAALPAVPLAVLLTFGVAACSDGETGGDPPARSSAPPGGASGPSGSPESAMPGPLLLNVRTTGGYAGIERQTLLYEDGTCTVSEEGGPSVTGRLTPAEVRQVRRLLDAARLAEGPRRTRDPHGADQFFHRISYDGHTVHRDDFTLGEPLRKALDILRGATEEGGTPDRPSARMTP